MKFNGRGLDCTTVTAKSIYLFEKVFFCCSPDPNETSDNMTAVTYPYTDAMLMEDDHQPLLGAAARPTYDIESGEGGGMYEYLFSMSGIPTTATATNTNTTVVATVATEGNGIETEVLSNASFPAIASSSLSPVRRAKRAFVSDALSVVSEEPSQLSETQCSQNHLYGLMQSQQLSFELQKLHQSLGINVHQTADGTVLDLPEIGDECIEN